MQNDQKITPFLWFGDNAEEALNYYHNIFKGSEIKNIVRWEKGSPGPEGTLLTATLAINGLEFNVLNGRPQDIRFNDSTSLMIQCHSQEEIDYYWESLTADGGEENVCGWLRDKFGFSWQVAPVQLLELIRDKNAEKANRVMDAMRQMRKIDIKKIEEARDGK